MVIARTAYEMPQNGALVKCNYVIPSKFVCKPVSRNVRLHFRTDPKKIMRNCDSFLKKVLKEIDNREVQITK